MPKPAVIHVITRLDLGGAQKSCLALITELQANYPDFEIYLISGTQGELVKATQKLKNVYLLDSFLWEIHPKNILLELQNFIKITTIMRQLKAKHSNIMVHTHTIKAGTIGRWAALFAGIKTRIHTIHGFGFNLFQNKLVWLFFYLIELFNSFITTHFICVSSQDLQAGSEIFPKFAQKASIIRAATLNTPCFVPSLRLKTQATILGTIACLKTGKNLFELLKAFKLAQKTRPELYLEIMGDGPLRPALQQYINDHNLAQNVQILGWQHNPAIYTQKWDGFLFTSLWEGLPCALVEIQNLGIPIYSYQVGGLIDLIDKSKLIYPGKWLDLATQIINHIPKQTPTFPNQPDLGFYIPKMALGHNILYQRLNKHVPI